MSQRFTMNGQPVRLLVIDNSQGPTLTREASVALLDPHGVFMGCGSMPQFDVLDEVFRSYYNRLRNRKIMLVAECYDPDQINALAAFRHWGPSYRLISNGCIPLDVVTGGSQICYASNIQGVAKGEFVGSLHLHFPQLQRDPLPCEANLGEFWDTLGWVTEEEIPGARRIMAGTAPSVVRFWEAHRLAARALPDNDPLWAEFPVLARRAIRESIG